MIHVASYFATNRLFAQENSKRGDKHINNPESPEIQIIQARYSTMTQMMQLLFQSMSTNSL